MSYTTVLNNAGLLAFDHFELKFEGGFCCCNGVASAFGESKTQLEREEQNK